MHSEIDEIELEKSITIKENIREKNIQVIGTSPNLSVLKRKMHNMTNRGIRVRDAGRDIEKILLDGARHLEKLAGDDPLFTPCTMMREQGVIPFFRAIHKDKKELERAFAREQQIEKEMENVKKRIEKAESKGQYKKAAELKADLYLLEKPEEVADVLKKHLADLELSGKTKSKEYKDIRKKMLEFDRDARIQKGFWGIGEEYEGLIYDLREFLGKYFYRDRKSENVLRLLENHYGETQMDYEHLFALHSYMKAHSIEDVEKVEAAMCYKMLESVYMDSKSLQEATSQGVVKPHFDTKADAFDWGRFPNYRKKLMMYLTLEDGFEGYYIEPSRLGHTGYRMAKVCEELDYSEIQDRYMKARKEASEAEKGFFYDWLGVDEESRLLPYIMNGSFSMVDMRGEHSRDLAEEYIIRSRVYQNERMSNLYDRLVKPYSLDMLGSVLNNSLGQFSGDTELGRVYYVSPERIALALRKDRQENLEDIFGDIAKALKKVEKPSFSGLLKEGYF